jgi:hypothetical protein
MAEMGAGEVRKAGALTAWMGQPATHCDSERLIVLNCSKDITYFSGYLILA